MDRPSTSQPTAQERLWRNAFFGGSALMAAFALVDLDAGRYAAAAGDAGVSCLLLSLMNQFPLVRAIVGATSRGGSPEELQRETERIRSSHPWTERLASLGWTLFLGSLILRALGAA
jgi:hypothetical protein